MLLVKIGIYEFIVINPPKPRVIRAGKRTRYYWMFRLAFPIK